MCREMFALGLSLSAAASVAFAIESSDELSASKKHLLKQSWSNEMTRTLLSRLLQAVPESQDRQELISSAIASRIDSIVAYSKTRHTEPYRRAFAHKSLLELELAVDGLRGRAFKSLPADDVREKFFSDFIESAEGIIDEEFSSLSEAQRNHVRQMIVPRLIQVRDDPLRVGYAVSCTESNSDSLLSTFENALRTSKGGGAKPSFHNATKAANFSIRSILRVLAELEPKPETKALPIRLETDEGDASKVKPDANFDEVRSAFFKERISLLKTMNDEFTASKPAEVEAAKAATEAKFAETIRLAKETQRELQTGAWRAENERKIAEGQQRAERLKAASEAARSQRQIERQKAAREKQEREFAAIQAARGERDLANDETGSSSYSYVLLLGFNAAALLGVAFLMRRRSSGQS